LFGCEPAVPAGFSFRRTLEAVSRPVKKAQLLMNAPHRFFDSKTRSNPAD
jgi:hypothetical protein